VAGAYKERTRLFVSTNAHDGLRRVNLVLEIGINQNRVVLGDLHLIDLAMRGAKDQILILFILLLAEEADT
jgi:hypothetical protein